MQRICLAKALESKGPRLGLSAPGGKGAPRLRLLPGFSHRQISIYSYKAITPLIVTSSLSLGLRIPRG